MADGDMAKKAEVKRKPKSVKASYMVEERSPKRITFARTLRGVRK